MRGREEGQFAGYDSDDTRKLIYRLLDELGHGLDMQRAAVIRGQWLKRLIAHSGNGFAGRMCASRITPCDAPEAFRMFTAITGVLGVPIAKGVELLEETIRLMR